ncbi:hypothetical protein [Streptomyces sp. NPDC005573]|uniref:hypothetical protein n=1 Tax=Streptomyces sp. NPDC005573 TaxID=3156890 RepID=UPI0033ABA066
MTTMKPTPRAGRTEDIRVPSVPDLPEFAVVDAPRPPGMSDVPMLCGPHRLQRALREARGGGGAASGGPGGPARGSAAQDHTQDPADQKGAA